MKPNERFRIRIDYDDVRIIDKQTKGFKGLEEVMENMRRKFS